jgi:transcriptional regulator with XRE-family HTH domain
MTEATDWAGDRLRAARMARGWSQQELAYRIDAGVRSVWRWENGQSRPRGRHTHLLEQLFRDHPPLLPADQTKNVRLQCRGCAELTKLVVDITTDLVQTRAHLAALQGDTDTRRAS